MRRLRTPQFGFTAGELTVTVAIATILLSIAGPSYVAIIRTTRLTTQIYDFYAALNLARSEAVKRGTPVTLCPSTNLTTCAASGTQWESGWIVFVDANNNHAVDAGDEILRAAPALAGGYTLRGTSATTLPTYITMNPKGQTSATGQFVLCQGGNINPARAILVSIVGRISTARDDNGVPVDANGADMTTCTP